ncbi:MAG: Rnf-Nqr domain containing protein [Candidatus Limivicinus sp.]
MNETKKSPKLLEAIGANPVLVLLLGACPAMALTTDVRAALAIGLAALVVMVLSSVVIAALARLIPQGARLAACVLVTTAFVSAVEMLMNAYLPSVYSMMGIYLAVCAVNLLVFGAAENAAEAGFGKALVNALVTGLVFTAVILVVAAIRELFGYGSFAGNEIAFLKAHAVVTLTQPTGGFMIFAFVAAVVNKLFPGCCCAARGTAFAAAGLTDVKCAEKEEV